LKARHCQRLSYGALRVAVIQERFNLKPGIASGNFTARFALRRDQERYF
jgi:hypothetical protein